MPRHWYLDSVHALLDGGKYLVHSVNGSKFTLISLACSVIIPPHYILSSSTYLFDT